MHSGHQSTVRCTSDKAFLPFSRLPLQAVHWFSREAFEFRIVPHPDCWSHFLGSWGPTQKVPPEPIAWNALSILSPRSCRGSGVTLRSPIHLELCRVRGKDLFSFSCSWSPGFPTPFAVNVSFLQCTFPVSLLATGICSYIELYVGPLFQSMDPCVCFCDIAIVL